MFYSHEILTSRKYGVATVWLVATLGAKSNAKKLTRKAICDVNLRKACETIMEPEVPMALRLQSNLLYGVARVYSQQCGYVLTDAQSAQNMMRDLLKVTRNNDLDPTASKARPEQLVIGDDPAFVPDMALPDFVEFLAGDLKNDSQRSSQSMMSLRHRSGSVQSEISLPSMNLGSSSSHVAYQLPDPFGGSSIQKPGGGAFGEEEPMIYSDADMIFEFDEDGGLRDIPPSEREARRACSVHPQAHLGSDSASARVRKEHEDVFAGHILPALDGEGDFDMINYGPDGMDLPADVEPFPAIDDGMPMMSGALQGQDQHLHGDYPDRVRGSEKLSSDESSVSAEAPLRGEKKPKAPKKIAVDPCTALRNDDLIHWRDEYVQNMAEATAQSNVRKGNIQAKKNALHFVYGIGINDVGEGFGSMKFKSPLDMFSGDALRAQLTGLSISSPPKRSKRTHSDVEDAEQNSSPKRSRQGENEVGRGFEEDGPMINFEDEFNPDQSVEIGRDAASALPDYPSSAMMPWNVSASLHSHQRGASSKGLGSQIGSIGGRRMTSASPLVGRGSALPSDLDNFPLLHEEEDQIMYGRSDDFEDIGGGGAGVSSSQGGPPLVNDEDFELFGPAANVDTQTAGTSQWVRQALDRESNNFFEYVKNTIEEKTGDELDGFVDVLRDGQSFVTFDEMFDSEANTAIVAAQAFYHILCLATKGRVWVEQDGVEEGEPFGGIRVGVASL